MALAKCSECGKQVSSDASKCPHCGTNNPCPSPVLGIIYLLGFAFIGYLFFAGDCSDSGTKKPSSSQANVHAPDHDAGWAYVMAQGYVEEKLVSPRTAKWPWIHSDDITEYLGNGRYEVTSYVDSENSFGALIRTQFRCVVRHVGGDTWRLEDLTLY